MSHRTCSGSSRVAMRISTPTSQNAPTASELHPLQKCEGVQVPCPDLGPNSRLTHSVDTHVCWWHIRLLGRYLLHCRSKCPSTALWHRVHSTQYHSLLSILCNPTNLPAMLEATSAKNFHHQKAASVPGDASQITAATGVKLSLDDTGLDRKHCK